MATKRGRGKESPDLGELIDQIITDANGDDEQLWAFRQALKTREGTLLTKWNNSGIRRFVWEKFPGELHSVWGGGR